jgi:hypothetical protein
MSFNTLVAITDALKPLYPESKTWNKSKFLWIQTSPAGRKGSIGRQTVAGLLNHANLTATLYKGMVLVNGNNIAVKFGMMWDKKKIIKFENIRDGEFHYIFCLAIYPENGYGWLIPKEEIWKDGVIREDQDGVKSQHKGADAWLHVDPAKVPKWLKKYGGELDEVLRVARKSL